MKKIILVVTLALALGSCNKLDELLVNPNAPDPSQGNVDLYFTQTQLSFVGLFNSLSSTGMELTRMIVMYGPNYQNAYSPTSFDGAWSTAYTGVFKHANEVIRVGTEQRKYSMVGITKILKAYAMMSVVDMFGNVPYTEANQGQANLSPKAETGSSIYTKAIVLLDSAISDLNKTAITTSYPGTLDLFYGTSTAAGNANWRRVAKTLKLRALIQTRLVQDNAAAVQALLTENDLINTNAQDFEFKYGSKVANPSTRHPFYVANYTAAGNASDYMGTYFLWVLNSERTVGSGNFDPRMRYYVYRQQTNYGNVNANSSSCSVETRPAHFEVGLINPYTGTTYNMPFCLAGGGLWGRDHGDNSGIPPDANLRTTWGIYPAGGEIDFGQGSRVSLDRGARGAGIAPIWQSAFTDFLRAEAALYGLATGDPKELMTAGLRGSIAKVLGYPATVNVTVPSTIIPSQTRIDNFVNVIRNAYDLASDNNGRMAIIGKEFYVSLWGNGIDAYNLYRRTGTPTNFQFTKVPNPGPYIRSLIYPSDYVNLNKNAVQKSGTGFDTPVFWDNNPASLFR
jgi:hypothetical protein